MQKVAFSSSTDLKCLTFEPLILQSGLSRGNRNLSDLEFIPGGTFFVDLTLFGDNVYKCFFFSKFHLCLTILTFVMNYHTRP